MSRINIVEASLLILQLSLFTLGRLMDDISWYDVGLPNEIYVCEGIGVAGMSICVVLQIIRKKDHDNIFKILFLHSQLKFIIPWALVITICFLFFNIFGCTPVLPEDQQNYFFINYTGCCLNIAQILLTNLNYSFLLNTKTHLSELVLSEIILFGQIIYSGNLLMLFINNMQGKVKDLSILLISIIIANQILIMDLMFRAAYEEKQREEEKESIQRITISNKIIPQSNSVQNFEMDSPTKKN